MGFLFVVSYGFSWFCHEGFIKFFMRIFWVCHNGLDWVCL